MTDITINEWKRYGLHRAYAADANGAQLGFLDLKTGAVTLEPGTPPEPTTSRLLAWAAERDIGAAPASDIPVLHTEPAGYDLALNVPGQAVAAKAQQEWDAYSARKPTISKLARFFGMNTPDRSWSRGAAGEREVGRRLEQLVPEGWRVLHSIPVGSQGADIDHLLIGPGGVFCINTKNHSNASVWVSEHTIMVNGTKQPYLRNSRTEGARVSRELSRATGWDVKAVPVIIVMARRYTERSRPRDVWIVGRRYTPQAFRRLPAIYSFEAVETLYRVARDSAKWVPKKKPN